MRAALFATFVAAWFVAASALAWRVLKQGRSRRAPSVLTALVGVGVGIAVVLAIALPADAFEHSTRLLALGTMVAVVSSLWLLRAYLWLGSSFNADIELVPDHVLRTDGPYAVVRHPIYLGLVGLVLATVLMTSWWMTPLVVFAAAKSVQQAWAEEGTLRAEYDAFEAYRLQTPDLIFPGDRWLQKRESSRDR